MAIDAIDTVDDKRTATGTVASPATGPDATPGLGAGAPSRRGRWRHRPRLRRRFDPVALLAGAVVLVPTIAAMVSALRNEWAPTNDWALLELAVRDVGTADTPLLGAWSRFGWRHPGPLPFYLLAVPYRLAPSGAALLFAAAAVNFLTVAGCVALALRRSRALALGLLAGLAALQMGLGINQLADPWNPTLPVLPFALYVLLCFEWALAPRAWVLPAAAAVGSFVVQAHVGLAQPIIAVGVAALVLRRRLGTGAEPGHGRGRGARPWWRRAVPTAAVLAVAWLPVAIDQVTRTGNLGRLVRWSLGSEAGPGMGELTEGRLPFGRVADSAAWLLGPFGPWLGRSDPINAYGYELLGTAPPWLLVWVPVALAGAVLLVRRAGRAEDRRAVTTLAAIAAAGVASVVTDLLTAEGAPVYWPFLWAAVVVMAVWVAVAWAVTSALVRRHPALDGLGVVVVAVPVVIALAAGTMGAQPEQAESDALRRLVPAIEREARGRPVVVANSTVLLNPVDLGLPVVLERAGIDWVDYDDPRAEGHSRLTVMPASALEGMVGTLIADGHGEVLARSGRPGPGEPPDSELVFVAYDPGAGPSG